MTFWSCGEFLCKFSPLLQDALSFMTWFMLLALALEAYRNIVLGKKEPFSYVAVVGGSASASFCLAIPVTIFVTHYSFQLSKESEGEVFQSCVVEMSSMEEYTRAMFILLYILPALSLAFFLIQCSRELGNPRASRESEEACAAQLASRLVKKVGLISSTTFLLWAPIYLANLATVALASRSAFRKKDDASWKSLCLETERTDLIIVSLVWVAFLSTVVLPFLALRLSMDDELTRHLVSLQSAEGEESGDAELSPLSIHLRSLSPVK